MATKLELLQEAYNRGILPKDKVAIYEEAQSRGLLKGTEPQGDYAEDLQLTTQKAIAPEPTPITGTDTRKFQQEQYSPEKPKEFLQETAPAVRTTLEIGGSITGSTIGSVAGPYGTVGGGILGYMGGSQAADRYEEFIGVRKKTTIAGVGKDLVKDVKQGAINEAFGVTLAFLGRAVRFLKPNLTEEAVKKEAGKILVKIRKIDRLKTDFLEANIKEADEVTKSLGVKTPLTHGQRSGGLASKSAEWSASTGGAKETALMHEGEVIQEARAGLDKIVFDGERAIKNAIDSGDDLYKAIDDYYKNLQKAFVKTKAKGAETIGKVTAKTSQQIIGNNTRGALSKLADDAKAEVDNLYAALPDDPTLPVNQLHSAIKEIRKTARAKAASPRVIPTSLMNRFMNITTKVVDGKRVPKDVTLKQLRGLRETISEEKAIAYGSENMALYRRLKQLEKGIDDTIAQADRYGKQYAEARKAHNIYSDTYKEGQVGKALASGKIAGGYAKTSDEVVNLFTNSKNLDAVDEFVATVGKQEAKNIVKDKFYNDLYMMVDDSGRVKATQASNYLRNNSDILGKYGLYTEVDDFVKAGEMTDVAEQAVNDFGTKTIKAVLNANPDKIISEIFSKGGGSAYSAKAMREILSNPAIKNNPAAQKVLKERFVDFWKSEIETVKRTALNEKIDSIAKLQKFFKRYEPAMRELFKGEQSKINAMKQYHSLLLMLERNKNIVYTHGSQTTEKLRASFQIIRSVGLLGAMSAGQGFKYQATNNIFSGLMKIIKNQEGVERVMQEALFDPNLADEILKLAKGDASKKLADSIMYKAGKALAIIAKNVVTEEPKPEPEKPKEPEAKAEPKPAKPVVIDRRQDPEGNWWKYTEEEGWQRE